MTKYLAIIAVILIPLAYWKGYQDQAQSIALKTEKLKLELLERSRTLGEEIDKLDDYNLCLRLGGVQSTCSQFLHRVDEATDPK